MFFRIVNAEIVKHFHIRAIRKLLPFLLRRKISFNDLPRRLDTEILTNILLRLLAHSATLRRILVHLDNLIGKRLRSVSDLHDAFRLRDSLGTDGSSDDGRSIIDRLDNLSLDSGTVTQRNHNDPGCRIERCKLFLCDEALDDDAASRLLKRLDLIRHLGSDNIEVHIKLLSDQREDLLCEPENRVSIRRMRESTDKQQSFPLFEVLVDILQELLVDIGSDRPDLVLRMDRMDCFFLHVRRIVGYRR